MKTLLKSISSLNDYNININKTKTNIGFKFPNSTLNIKKKKKFLFSLYINPNKYDDVIKKDNDNLLKKNLLKNPIDDDNIVMRKTRNKTMKDVLKFKKNIRIIKKINSDDIKQDPSYSRKNNYLLLTSLYNLPKIKKSTKFYKNMNLSSRYGDTNHTEQPKGNNITTINSKSIFNESSSLSSDKLRQNSLNLLYSKNDSMTSNNNISIKKKKSWISSLSYLLKNKYYSDTEKLLKDKITIKSFPYDHSLKDKVIHMKKVGVFWDSVFKYCVPLINIKKYKMQRDLSERKKLNYLKLIKSKSNYDDFESGNNIINPIKPKEIIQSKPIFYTSRTISDNIL